MRSKNVVFLAFCLFMLLTPLVFSRVHVGADIGGYHSYVQGDYYRAGFYAGAYAYTELLQYTTAYAECYMAVNDSGYGAHYTWSDDEIDSTPPVFVNLTVSAPGYVTNEPGNYRAYFRAYASLSNNFGQHIEDVEAFYTPYTKLD